MNSILEPIPLRDLLDENHLAAVTAAIGKEAGDVLLSEPNMRDFTRIMTARDDENESEEEFSQRESFGVTACLRDAEGKRPMTQDQFLEIPATTGRKLSMIVGSWIIQIHKEANEGLGKVMEKTGLSTPQPNSKQSAKTNDSSN